MSKRSPRHSPLLLGGVVALLACTPSAAPAPTVSAPAAAALGAATSGAARPEPAAAAPSLERVRALYGSISVTVLPVWLAKDAGLFEKHGLDVSVDYIPSGNTMIQTMVAGEAEFGTGVPESAISATLAGTDLTILAPTADR